MIEQGFNYVDSTIKDSFETRVENLEPKEEKKKSSAAAKKSFKKAKKRKKEDFNSIVVESSEESTKALRPSKKYCVLHGKCSHSTDCGKEFCAMVNKRNKKRKKIQKLQKEQQRA